MAWSPCHLFYPVLLEDFLSCFVFELFIIDFDWFTSRYTKCVVYSLFSNRGCEMIVCEPEAFIDNSSIELRGIIRVVGWYSYCLISQQLLCNHTPHHSIYCHRPTQLRNGLRRKTWIRSLYLEQEKYIHLSLGSLMVSQNSRFKGTLQTFSPDVLRHMKSYAE